MATIFDTFMFNNELDILECRLYELEPVKNLVHVIVEADVDHQDHPKPWNFEANRDRFDKWADRILYVKASGLPTAADAPDPWAREHAQREYVAGGLAKAGCQGDDIILHGDIDEIPRVLPVRNIRPQGLVAFEQRGHFWAVDWLYPEPWRGTVAGKASTVFKLGLQAFGRMRDARNVVPCPPYLKDAGWHLSWLGTADDAMRKVGSFCHPEVKDRIVDGLDGDQFRTLGYHVDGKRMAPVDVDESWPRWIVDGHAPAEWFRPR